MAERHQALIPAKSPIGSCAGWLNHNLRNCECYEAEREAIDARERKGWLARLFSL